MPTASFVAIVHHSVDVEHGAVASAVGCSHNIAIIEICIPASPLSCTTTSLRRMWYACTARSLHIAQSTSSKDFLHRSCRLHNAQLASNMDFPHCPWLQLWSSDIRNFLPPSPLPYTSISRRRAWPYCIAFGLQQNDSQCSTWPSRISFGLHTFINRIGRGPCTSLSVVHLIFPLSPLACTQ